MAAIGAVWVTGLLAAGVIAVAGQTDVAVMMVALTWVLGLLAVVWLALVGPPNPVRMPPRHLPVVPPLSRPDPQTRDLERLLTRQGRTTGTANDLAAALSELVARVPQDRHDGLPKALVQYCREPGRPPSHIVVDRWLAHLEEATHGR